MSHISHRPGDHEARPFIPQPKMLSYSSAVSGKWKQGPLPSPTAPQPESDEFPSLPSPFGSDLSFSSSPTSSSHDTLPPIPELPELGPSTSSSKDADEYTVDLHTPLLAELDRLLDTPDTFAFNPHASPFSPTISDTSVPATLTPASAPVAQHPPHPPPLRPWSTPLARALAARTPAARATHAHAVVALRDWTPARTADLARCVAAPAAAATARALDNAFRACYGDAGACFAWCVRECAIGGFGGWWALDGVCGLRSGEDAVGALAQARAVGALSAAGVLAHGDLRDCVRMLASRRGTLEGLRALGALLAHGDAAGLRECAGEVRGVLAGLQCADVVSAVGAPVEEGEVREVVEEIRRMAEERVFGPAEA